MLGELVYAPWVKRSFKARAFFFNKDALIVDRGVYEFDTRTVDDVDWQWLSRQIDQDQIVYGDVCAADLLYEYIPGGIVLGRDAVLNYIRLILAPIP